MREGYEIIALRRDGTPVSVPVDFDTWVHHDGYGWRVDRDGYVYRNTRKGQKNVTLYLHRVVVLCPRGKEVDHKDGDRSNNMRNNLSIVTPADNKALMHLRRRHTVTLGPKS